MKQKLLVLINCLIIFVIVVLSVILISPDMEEIWNYGFSYAIKLGEIPYNDFNMIIPPLYPYLMAIPLLIKNTYIVFILFNSFFITIEFYLLYKLYKDKSYLLLILSIILTLSLLPTYNSFLIFLLVLILYINKKNYKYKDYLIGFIISLMILTKQNVGIIMLLPCIYEIIKDKKILKHRLIGFIIPMIIFLIYLIINNNLYSFIDLCFLGLFDFTGNSKNFNIVAILITLAIIILSIYIIKKTKKDINNYYILASYSVIIPLIDQVHVIYLLFLFGLFLVNNLNFKTICKKVPMIVITSVIVLLQIFQFVIYKDRIFNNINHFKYKYFTDEMYAGIEDTKKYIESNDVIMFEQLAYFFRIITNDKITYLDLPNHGNYGINGSNKLIDILKNNKDKKIMVNHNEIEMMKNNENQLDKKTYEYIIDNYKVVEVFRYHIVYEYNKEK